MDKIGIVRILEDSVFTYTALSHSGDTEISIDKGSLYSKIIKLDKRSSYKVKTPSCVAAVRGTEFLVSIANKQSDVLVRNGKVAVAAKSAPEKEVIAEQNQGVAVEDQKLDKRALNNVQQLTLEKYSLTEYIEDLDNKSETELKSTFDEIQKKEEAIDKKIQSKTEYISPLDRLRKQGKPLTMLHLRDGSQMAGAVLSANDKFLSFDTGDGVVKVPTDEILRRVMMK